MRAILFCCLALSAMIARATHLLGGELYYTALGNDDYEVTLNLFRDCGPGNDLGTGFDTSVEIGVFDVNGNYLTSHHIFTPSEGEQVVPVDLSNACLTAPPTICVRQMRYRTVVHLPSGQGGYTLSYQRCCRTPTILNLASVLQGITCTVRVTDPAQVGINSSPRFNAYPPVALCAAQYMEMDLSASDPDGDELHYDLCAPFIGGDSQFNVIPSPPDGPPYTPVFWAPTYSVANMMNAAPPLAVDANTGLLTVTPTLIGSFCVGVRVREFRDGAMLSEVVRDFRFDVTNCTVNVQSVIAEQDASSLCAGRTIPFTNNSIGGQTFHWDFGVSGVADDTSTEDEPTFTYPDTGVYVVTLIANPDLPCADTSQREMRIYDPIDVHYTAPGILCPTQLPVTLQVEGNVGPNAAVTWDIGNGTSPDVHAHALELHLADLGAQAVGFTATEHGCSGSFMDSVRVFPLPVADFVLDTGGCVPFALVLSDRSTAWTPMVRTWEFSDGGMSLDSVAHYTFERPGTYDVKLTVNTTTGCVASSSMQRPNAVDVWPLPQPYVTADPLVTGLMHPYITFTDASIGAAVVDIDVAGTHYVNEPTFTHVFDDAGWYHVQLTATSPLGCVDTSSVNVFVGDHFFYAPNAFSPNGDNTNEVWLPSVRGARLYRLEVYDRWGQVQFSTSDPKAAWDGKDALPGVYAYKAWLSEYGPLEKEYNGSIILLR